MSSPAGTQSPLSQLSDEDGGRERLVVLVPCLNEEHTIDGSIASIQETVPELDLEVEVLMIDDGSTDRTRDRMEALCAQHENCHMVVNPKNLGVGRTVIDAYELVPPRAWVTVFPGDNELVFSSIKSHLAVRSDYDVVLGYLANPVIRPLRRRAASQAFSMVARALYGFPYRYLNGFKLYRVEAFKGIEVVSRGHAFAAELIAKALLRNPQLRIGEVPFIARGRARGSSKAIRVTSILQAMKEMVLGFRSVGEYRRQKIRGE